MGFFFGGGVQNVKSNNLNEFPVWHLYASDSLSVYSTCTYVALIIGNTFSLRLKYFWPRFSEP